MSEQKKLKKGHARLEFIASLDLIKKLWAEGHNILMIYSHLFKEKRITMSYAGFYENFSGRRQGSRSVGKQVAPLSEPKQRQNRRPEPHLPPPVNMPKGSGNVIDGGNMFSQLAEENKEFLEINSQSEDI